jgi:hypothetical protein
VTAGSWSFDYTGTTLADNSYTLDADLIDAAGNIAATAADQTLVIDTVDPVLNNIAITDISDDSGTLGDFITNDNDGLTVSATLDFALVTGESLWYSNDDGTTWADVTTTSVTGTSVNVVDAALTSTNTVRFEVRDTAGNVGATASQLITIQSTLELLPGSLDGVSNLDVKSLLTLEFSDNIILGTGEIRIMDDNNNAGWIMSNPETGLQRQDVYNNDVVITLTGGVITNLTIGGVGYASFGGTILTPGITLAEVQKSITVTGNKLIISPAGLDNEFLDDWDFDWDFGANYHVELDAGVVTTTDGLTGVTAVTDSTTVNFSTVAPLGNATGAASQQIDSDGVLSAGYIYHHSGRSDVTAAGFAMDFSSGSHVLVIDTAGGTTKQSDTPADPVGVGGKILLSGFGANDLIYNDNLGNMAMLTTDGVHAGQWAFSDPAFGGDGSVSRILSSFSGETQRIDFIDYASTGFIPMGNINYSWGDGRFEDSLHWNSNVITFG